VNRAIAAGWLPVTAVTWQASSQRTSSSISLVILHSTNCRAPSPSWPPHPSPLVPMRSPKQLPLLHCPESSTCCAAAYEAAAPAAAAVHCLRVSTGASGGRWTMESACTGGHRAEARAASTAYSSCSMTQLLSSCSPSGADSSTVPMWVRCSAAGKGWRDPCAAVTCRQAARMGGHAEEEVTYIFSTAVAVVTAPKRMWGCALLRPKCTSSCCLLSRFRRCGLRRCTRGSDKGSTRGSITSPGCTATLLYLAMCTSSTLDG
jgi:hypothetical protein